MLIDISALRFMSICSTYFGISSLPGRCREGGRKCGEGIWVLLGKVWVTGGGGCHWLGRSRSGGDGVDDDDAGAAGWEEEEDTGAGVISGVLRLFCDCSCSWGWDWGWDVSTRLMGTILSFYKDNIYSTLTEAMGNIFVWNIFLADCFVRTRSDQLASGW